jgi:transposase InsO family protein
LLTLKFQFFDQNIAPFYAEWSIVIERLWRTIKYEHIYLNLYEDGLSLYKGLQQYFSFYNDERRHQLLNYETPSSFVQPGSLKPPVKRKKI